VDRRCEHHDIPGDIPGDVTLNGELRPQVPEFVALNVLPAASEGEQTRMIVSRKNVGNWQLRSRTLALGARTLVMGVVNITPDSFTDGGLFLAPEAAVVHAMQLLDEGADLIDLGAESTRPGSRAGGAEGSANPPAVSADEEQARLLPVLEGILRARPEAIVSVDTYKAATARAALHAGAEIVNDVSGFVWDAEMAAVCAEFGAGVVLMHTRGRPEEWRTQPQLAPDALMTAVRAGLEASLAAAAAAGIPREAIVLDPGYGFGKRFGENYALLARQDELLALGRPLLAGVSRKSFLGRTLAPLYGSEVSVEARETASLAAMTAAILHGASIVRVHAVFPAVEAARIADAIVSAGTTLREPPATED
jgi:dihydropteroate synthase